jgi:anti-sigma factor RsiW
MSPEAMADCREIEANLAAYVDGESCAIDRAALESHLNACPPCRRRAVAERAAHQLVCARREHLRGCAPSHLKGRCAAQRAALHARRGLFSPRRWVPVSLAASVLLAAGLLFVFAWGSSVETYAAQLALDHVKCFQFPPDGSSSDDVLMGRTWQKANGWSLKVAAASAAEQLQLLGIRRCGSTKGRVAHIFYRWRDRPLSVYVLNGRVDESEQVGRDQEHAHSVARFGENAVIWTDHGRTYAVVARAPAPELQQVASYFRRRVE